jgi:cytochrome c oxidase subunit IV
MDASICIFVLINHVQSQIANYIHGLNESAQRKFKCVAFLRYTIVKVNIYEQFVLSICSVFMHLILEKLAASCACRAARGPPLPSGALAVAAVSPAGWTT